MARKAGDLMSLLAHRGAKKRRKKSGGLQNYLSVFRTALGGRAKGGSQARKSVGSGNVLIVALAFGFLGVGFLLGSAFPWGRSQAMDPLAAGQNTVQTNQASVAGVVPGPIGERLDLQPLSSTFLLTAAYDEYGAASAAAEKLRRSGLQTARPYALQRGYGLVVYYDGARAAEQVRTRLASVPAPDPTFEEYRKRGKGWPVPGPVR